MLRTISSLLVILFLGQGSGATALANSQSSKLFFASAKMDFGQILASAQATQIGALLTGSERYAAMHSTPPARVSAPHVDVSKTRLTEVIRPQSNGRGLRAAGPPLRATPLLPKDAAKLPAPPPSSGGAGTITPSTLRAALSAPVIARGPAFPVPSLRLPPHKTPGKVTPFDVTTSSPNTTGINPWWSYESGALPGTGKYMVNVGTGNVFVQSEDIDVAERGINLEFDRTYNSMSLNDTNGSYGNDDGSATPNIFGNGWTNAFGTHLAINTSGGVTVYALDGSRYDYTPNGTGCLTPPAGMHNSLCWDQGCGYFWTTADGTTYHYWAPSFSGAGLNCAGWGASTLAYQGRLYMIMGRNWHNWISLTYYWAGGDASTTANLTQIVAQHADGHALTMAFGVVNGRILLSSVTRPDGAQVTYGYDGAHNLVAVTRPGNNAASTLTDSYGYYDAARLAWTANPRWNLSGGTAGSFTNFYYDGNGRSTGVLLYGFANPTPSDGMNTPIQPGYTTGGNTIAYKTFSYPTAGETSMTDIDGHATNWFYDSAARVTQTQSWSGSLWLIGTASWDGSNNLIATTDPRGNETDAAYDAAGNVTAAALPQITTTNGAIRPTIVLSYDQYNNVTSYCNPMVSNANGLNWSTPPGQSDTRCPNTGTNRVTYDYSDGSEPYGKMTDVYTPMGYHTHFAYDTSGATGDAGLATAETSDSFTENDDTSITPSRSAQFDVYGNVLSLGSGVGSWAYSYDSLNQLSTTTDPDGVASYRHYNADGTVSNTETAYQHATNTGATYTYDADENQVSESHYRGGTFNSNGSPTIPTTPGSTASYYDGADRLVEVVLPYDQSNDVYTNPWITRYIYDLSQGGTVAFRGQAISAHGNLYNVQQFLPSGSQIQSWSAGSPKLVNSTATVVKGSSFDALDRQTAEFSAVNGQISTRSFTYDSNGAYGLLTGICNAVNQCGSATFDAAANVTAVAYNGGLSPNESYTYDPARRIITATLSNIGTHTVAYDADGRITVSQDPSGGNLSSPATLTYHYYPNGARSSVDVSSTGLTQAGILSYSYRADGATQTQAITDSANGSVGTTVQHLQFTPAGRFSQQTESGPGANAAAITATYQNGQLISKTLPGGSLSTFEYDPEGMILGYGASVGGGATQYLSFSYTTRGELVAASGMGSSSFANGVALENATDSNGDPIAVSWDDLMGVPLSTGGYTFDLAGRLTQDPSGTTRSFDANDHLTSEAYVGASDALLTYTWGANGHPAAIGSAFGSTMPSPSQVQSDTLHWDGDQILFTNTLTWVDDIKFGADSEILPADANYRGLTSYDRDITGNVAFCHNATGANGTAAADPYHTATRFITSNVSPCRGSGMTAPASGMWWGSPASRMPTAGAGTGQIIGMPAPDGIADDFNIIQGVRAYDPQLGTWETPDSYSGVIGDPMTQSSYAYKNNNPVNFRDPSGNVYAQVCDPTTQHVDFLTGKCVDNPPGPFYSFNLSFGGGHGYLGGPIMPPVGAMARAIVDFLCGKQKGDVKQVSVSGGDGLFGEFSVASAKNGDLFVSGGGGAGLSFPVSVTFSEGAIMNRTGLPTQIDGIMTSFSDNGSTTFLTKGIGSSSNASGIIGWLNKGMPSLNVGQSFGVKVGNTKKVCGK
jgi:YD repeat-containing protein